jgi:hypothetical protein
MLDHLVIAVFILQWWIGELEYIAVGNFNIVLNHRGFILETSFFLQLLFFFFILEHCMAKPLNKLSFHNCMVYIVLNGRWL